jgi:HAD superfamily hydrolase (TIGR01484 family)
MEPLAAIPAEAAARVRAVFTDIDDTLTTAGRIPSAAFDAMWRLRAAGIAVVPVTGRPAGWCDHIARMWPVAGVVGENGAFYFRYDAPRRKMDRVFILDAAARADLQRRLCLVGERILAEVPGAAIASDQAYRIHDLAIDYCEDVPPLPGESVDRIVSIFEQSGATAKVSSIHVNGWFGTYDKLAMTQILFRERFAVDLDADKETAVFVGDSPNDAPMFAFFPLAVGVANIARFAGRLAATPAYVTNRACGAGFAEVADALLEARVRAGQRTA